MDDVQWKPLAPPEEDHDEREKASILHWLEQFAPAAQPLPEGEKCERCGGRGFNFGAEPDGMLRCEACNGTGRKPLPEAPRCGGSDDEERIKLAKWLRLRAGQELGQRNKATLAEAEDSHEENALQLIAAAAVVDGFSLIRERMERRDLAWFEALEAKGLLDREEVEADPGEVAEVLAYERDAPVEEEVSTEEASGGGEFLDDYECSGLATEAIERLEVREAEVAEKLAKWIATHPGKHDSPSALVSYTEKRIYREAIHIIADTDLERHVYGRKPSDLSTSTDGGREPEAGSVDGGGLIPIDEDDRERLREIARLVEVDSIRDDAQRDARFLHRFAERPLASGSTDVEEERPR
jgi:hypothetical protein